MLCAKSLLHLVFLLFMFPFSDARCNYIFSYVKNCVFILVLNKCWIRVATVHVRRSYVLCLCANVLTRGILVTCIFYRVFNLKVDR